MIKYILLIILSLSLLGATFGGINSSTLIQRQEVLSIDQFRNGATAPTGVTLGTTPTTPALRFSSTSELVSHLHMMPLNWNNGDVTIVLTVALVNAETNGDVLDLTMDYVATIVNTTGSGVIKTSTQITSQATTTTANGLAIGDIYRITFSLSAADGTNPLANATEISFEFHMTNTTGVASFDLVSGCINLESNY